MGPSGLPYFVVLPRTQSGTRTRTRTEREPKILRERELREPERELDFFTRTERGREPFANFALIHKLSNRFSISNQFWKPYIIPEKVFFTKLKSVDNYDLCRRRRGGLILGNI